MVKTLDWKNNGGDLTLLLVIFQDTIKLKYGRRVPQYGIITMTECLNHFLSKKSAIMTTELKVSIAETMSLLYYYKHGQVVSLLLKSGVHITDGKHLFNH